MVYIKSPINDNLEKKKYTYKIINDCYKVTDIFLYKFW